MAAYIPTGITSIVNTIPSSVRVGASIEGTVPVTQGTIPWIVNQPSPSLIAYQSAGSIQAVSGTFNPGSVYVVNPVSTLAISTGNSSVQVLNFPANQSISGAVTQGTSPWIITGSVQASLTPAANQSVSGTVHIDNFSSVIAYQAAGSVMAVNATLTPPANQSVSGTVGIFPSSVYVVNPVSTITVTTGNSSVQLLGGVAVIGSVATLQGTNPWITSPNPASVYVVNPVSTLAISTGNSSVQLLGGTAVIGSVATLQGTNPWIIGNSSVLAFQGTLPWVIQSIVGTYAEDSGHTTNDKGLFTLGVRNDALASLVSADLEYTGIAVDAYGRTLIKPFADNGAAFSYHGSVVSGSVTLIKSSVIGKRSYITDFWLTNTNTVNSVATLLTFQDGSTSILGRMIVPAGGGSNSPGIAMPLKTNPSQDLAFAVSPAQSIVYVTVNGYTQ